MAAMPALATEPDAQSDGHIIVGGNHPGCESVDVRGCVARAIEAMGGRQKLAGIDSVHFEVIGHTALAEQSYRQAPFITAYERGQVTLDFNQGRVIRAMHMTWPESDPHTADSEQTLVASGRACVRQSKQGDQPCSLADLDNTAVALALGPERLLLNAAAASDLHYAPAQWLRSTPHAAIEFSWGGTPVRVLLNAFNHLPDALERTATFQDFWFAWGDVRQRVYFDNWRLQQGVVYPTNRIDERNGVLWESTQLLDVTFNPALDEKAFAMDAAVAGKSAQSKGWDRPFSDRDKVELAPGVELYRGAWNATLIRQNDGVLVLEAPIAPSYTQAVLAKARHEFPGLPITGVLSTSDSWPHMAGVRQAVAEGLPVFVLDLNQPLLAKLIAAPHSLHPDALQLKPMPPRWRIVSQKLEIGRGDNAVVAYPLRGVSTERQYMVYFPAHRLLYASDTLTLNQDHSLYDPQLMHEVVQAVQREHLAVDTVFAMHEGPTPWNEVLRLVEAQQK